MGVLSSYSLLLHHTGAATSILGFLTLFFFLDLGFSFFCASPKSNFLFKLFGFVKTNIFLSYTFLTSLDVLVCFTFFFLSLYFLELHLFFVYSLNLTSDGVVYQFNFLLSSFVFVFLIKTVSNVFKRGSLFTTNFSLNEFFFFSSADRLGSSHLEYGSRGLSYNYAVYTSVGVFVYKLVLFIFFFLSTFFVWLLRYIIQFIRLLVLFMIHTIFELVIIGSDSILSNYALNPIFFIKYIFFIFFYFSLFLYLIIYLNLMFTLQVFIFYFFSEVFQSNFVTDLSSFTAKKAMRVQ